MIKISLLPKADEAELGKKILSNLEKINVSCASVINDKRNHLLNLYVQAFF